MKVGIQTSCTDQTSTPQRLAVEVEARGFSTLLFPDHPHIPVARAVARPEHHGGGELPEYYKRTWDPFVACSFAAAATVDLEIGTGVSQLALRDPIVTAKSVASIDRLSGGRFVFGVGFGWNADEFPAHGQDFARRHRVVRERIGAMKALWTDDVASYEGTVVELPPSWSWPKPVARPHPPVIVGGDGPVAMRHAAQWADYWYPTDGALTGGLASTTSALRRLAEADSRDPDEVAIWPLVRASAAAPQVLAQYADAGVRRVSLALPSCGPDEQLRELDRFAALVGSQLG